MKVKWRLRRPSRRNYVGHRCWLGEFREGGLWEVKGIKVRSGRKSGIARHGLEI